MVILVRKKEKYHFILDLPRISLIPTRISYNYLNLFVAFRIDRGRPGWIGMTITPLPGSRCSLDSWRKWRAIKETAGATISLGNVSVGDDHITVKVLCGVLLTKCILTNQFMIRHVQVSVSHLYMSLPYRT